jgi:FkbM family methyltransferase
MLKSLQNRMLGRKRFQSFFEKLYYISKFGRNIGLPIDVSSSGEIAFIQLLGKKFNKKQVIFFDIGANHGAYTLQVLKFFPPNTYCYLFEPQETLCKELCNTFAENKNVTVIEKGCGSRQEKLKLYSFENIDTLASLYNSFKGNTSEAFSTIDIIRLDDFLNENSIPHIDLIKIDVEGHEFDVLRGMKTCIEQKKVDVIQFEFGSFNLISRIFFKDFWELLHNDYDIYRILKDGLFKIKAYSPDMEIFDTTNFAAVLK